MARKPIAETNAKYEGHDDPGQNMWPTVKKGTFLGVGTAMPLSNKAISPNVKSGSPSGGEAGGV